MIGSRRWVGAAVIVSNLGILIGALVFGWSPLTVVALFLADLFGGTIRMLIERTFASRPPEEGTEPKFRPVGWNAYYTRPIYEGLLGKRGTVRVTTWTPSVYLRNLPYLLNVQMPLTPWVLIVFIWLFFSTWMETLLLPAGSLDVTALVGLSLVLGRHILIVRTWHATGRYETASPATIRRDRDFLYAAFVACLVLMFVGLQPENTGQVAVSITMILLPKLWFDFRDAGIGPSLLIPDPRCDTEDDPVADVDGVPRRTFTTRTQALYSQASGTAVFHLFFPGLPLLCIIGLTAMGLQSWFVFVVLIAVLYAVIFALDATALWLAYANMEYRVYDDAIVAYDQYVEEPQWRLEADELKNARTETYIQQRLPHVTAPVVIERNEGEDILVEYLDKPEEFTQALRECVRKLRLQ